MRSFTSPCSFIFVSHSKIISIKWLKQMIKTKHTAVIWTIMEKPYGFTKKNADFSLAGFPPRNQGS